MMFVFSRRVLLAALAIAAFPIPAAAQSIGGVPVPGSSDPSRLDERVNEDLLKPPVTLPALPDAGKTETQPVGDKTRFELKSLTIDGATVFDAAALEPYYKDALDKEAGLQTLNEITDRITDAYHAKGFFLVRVFVPQQNIENGAVKLQVVEGYVARVRFDTAGVRGLSHDLFHVLGDIEKEIEGMRPLSAPKLEHQLLLISDLAGVKVDTILEALPAEEAEPGAVGMVVKMVDAGVQANVSVDNYGSKFSGPWEATGGAQISPGLFAFDSLTVSGLLTIPPDESKFISGSYSVPLNAYSTKMTVRGEFSNSQPGYNLESFDVDSNYSRWSGTVSQSIIRSRQLNWSVAGTFDYKNISTDFLGANLYRDHLRIGRIDTDVDYSDAWRGINRGSFTISHGFDMLNASQTGDPNLSRAGGSPDFTKVEASVSRLQTVDENFDVYAAASGQYAFSTLLSSEEYGFGGSAFGRAYDPSDILGDHGLAGSVELRYNGLRGWHGFQAQPFVYGDIGKVWSVSGTGDPSGASIGPGIRITHDSGVNGTFTVGVPLTRPVQYPQFGGGYAPRLLLQLGYRY